MFTFEFATIGWLITIGYNIAHTLSFDLLSFELQLVLDYREDSKSDDAFFVDDRLRAVN